MYSVFFQGGVLLCVYSCVFVIYTMGLIQIVCLFVYTNKQCSLPLFLAFTLFFSVKRTSVCALVFYFYGYSEFQYCLFTYYTEYCLFCFYQQPLFFLKKKITSLCFFFHAKEWVFCCVFMNVNLLSV